MRASETCSSTTFVDVDIHHRMAPLQMYIMTLTYIQMSRYMNGCIKFQWISNPVCRWQYNCCFLFHLFQVEWKTRIVSYLPNCSTNSRLRFMIMVLEVHKKNYAASMEVTAQLVSVFQMANVSPLKNKKTNISNTIQQIFIKFSPKW